MTGIRDLPESIAADDPAKALSFVLPGCIFNVDRLPVSLPVAGTAARAGAGLPTGPRGSRVRTVVGTLFMRLALPERA